jgi:HipA-like protein
MSFKLIRLAKDWLGRSKPIEAKPEDEAKFLLKYKNLPVGTLSVNVGIWTFAYSEEFKNQDRLRPILELPDVRTIYQSPDLWQFFAMRIPSLEQPAIGEILKNEHIKEDDAVKLLKRFGKRTIANPFDLQNVP